MVDLYAKGQPDMFGGAFVDIMPVDGLPDDPKEEKRLIRTATLCSKLNSMVRLYDVFPRKNMGPIQFVKDVFKKPVGFMFRNNYDYFSNRITKMFMKFPYDNSKKVCFTWRLGIEYRRLVFDKKMFDETIPMKFEDVYINVPNGYDSYLRQDFGDYMKIPNENERSSGHTAYIYDLTKPYEYYAQLEREKMKK